MATLVFVIGAARSGTNLLARVLDRHPSCTVALDPLLPVFRSLRDAVVSQPPQSDLSTRYPKGTPLQDCYFEPCGVTLLDAVLHAHPDIAVTDADLQTLRGDCVARAALESPVSAARFKALEGRTYRELVQSASDIISASGKHLRWCGFKEVWIHDFIPWLAKAFPGARFICIERDPRAVIASLLAVSDRDPTQAAHGPSYMRHWRKGVALMHRFLSDPVLGPRIMLVRYEELVAHPEPVVRNLCEFLDLSYDESLTAVSADGWQGNSAYQQTGRHIYSDSLHRWHETLPRDVADTVDFLCGPEMALTPYLPTSEKGLHPGIAAYLAHAHTEPCSWRSDSGDAEADVAWEALRHELLASGNGYAEALIRRCYLFADTFYAIRTRSHSGAAS